LLEEREKHEEFQDLMLSQMEKGVLRTLKTFRITFLPSLPVLLIKVNKLSFIHLIFLHSL
jgi:hypothetical protein